MKLTQKEIENTKMWEEKGFKLPRFNRENMLKLTKEAPEWLHFGAGNIFRAFPAAVCQELLNRGILKTGIIVAEGYDYEIIEKSYRKFDNLSILVTLREDGNMEKSVIASVAESLCADRSSDWKRLCEIFCSPSLKMVSFTITEKGYCLTDGKGDFLADVAEDFKKGPFFSESYMGKLASLCYERFKSTGVPLTLLSMDNCSHNGSRLHAAVVEFAKQWTENGLTEHEFLEYVAESISYPWSMIDKITPRPDESVLNALKEAGIDEFDAVVTAKNTYVAPFVNAEKPQYLVIEDNFKNGRLPLDEGGIIYTDKETVDKVEKMKVCTCLNPLHTSLAVFGCLLGYTKISDEMKDENLRKLAEGVGYAEGLCVVSDPGIIRPEDFIDEVLNVRLPNPFMPDTPQRIACDTSQKISIRFGETIKAYMKRCDLDTRNLVFIPLVIAGWCRYLMAVDDAGNAFELSPDPMLSTLLPIMEKARLGSCMDVHELLKDILSNTAIFGVDLYEAGLGEKIEKMFLELAAGVGAVRSTLVKYTK
ncbi:MAG: mannitol dehydrogenase family protein [Clostridia bacterium]|nr:mannitol dehydrogenase family protein [Clostridia bacterium]